MKTEIIKLDEENLDMEGVRRAAQAIREGKLVIFPTETVYGLGANALDENAALGIFRAKGRPADNPLIVHVTDPKELDKFCREIPREAYQLYRRFSPGPLTVVLKKKDCISSTVSGGLDTVAVRIPNNKIALAVIKEAGVPIAAPSANLSGKPSPTKFEHVLAEMDGRVDMIVDGGDCGVGVESTVVTLAAEKPMLLRPGAVTLAQLEGVLGRVELSKAILSKMADGEKAAAPGMKYRHYAPSAKMVLIKGFDEDAIHYIQAKAASCAKESRRAGVLCFDGEESLYTGAAYVTSYGRRDDSSSQAHGLFAALRSFDENNVDVIYARSPEEGGVGLAVYNRLIKAAGFNIIVV